MGTLKATTAIITTQAVATPNGVSFVFVLECLISIIILSSLL